MGCLWAILALVAIGFGAYVVAGVGALLLWIVVAVGRWAKGLPK